MKVLDLFSGIGGFSLGLERAGMETVAFCEINPFCRQVLRKHWPDVPIFEDVTKLRGEDIGTVDVISGGYPCQPFSVAGERRGAEDDRHLWPEFNRLVAELRPAWVIGENVAGHISLGVDQVLSDLEGQGYTCRAFILPACAVDAPHRRDRVWVIGSRNRIDAHCTGEGLEGHGGFKEACGACGTRRNPSAAGGENGTAANANNGSGVILPGKQRAFEKHAVAGVSGTVPADAGCVGSQGPWRAINSGSSEAKGNWEKHRTFNDCRWCPEPDVGRVANGIPGRVDRLTALGNTVVPQIPEMIGRAIMEAEA